MTATLTTFARHVAMLALGCLAITMNAGSATNRTLFDFETGVDPPAWAVVNDDVMGGVSTSRFEVRARRCAVFSGTVRLENNGGFASVRSPPVREDLTLLAAFVLRVRGDGRRYKFSVRTGPGFDTPNYQRAFTPKQGEWEEHRLAFSDFVPTFRGRVLTEAPPLDPAKVHSVGLLIADDQDGPFRLEIRWIQAEPARP